MKVPSSWQAFEERITGKIDGFAFGVGWVDLVDARKKDKKVGDQQLNGLVGLLKSIINVLYN